MIATPATLTRQLRRGERALSADPVLGPLIQRYGRCTLAPQFERGPYEALLEAVIFQQLHGKAAQTILGRFLALFPRGDFPSPRQVARLSDEQLRGVGLSRQKIAAIRDIALRTASGELPRHREEIGHWEDEAIIRTLSQARGVGRWTAEMVLIFTLGRLDVWPVDDYGVRAGYARAAGLGAIPTARAIAAVGVPWSPWRSIAAWYCWQVANDRQNAATT